jgi:hypothetical protein
VSAEQSEALYLKGNECHHLPGVKECLQNRVKLSTWMEEFSFLVFTWSEGVSADCRLQLSTQKEGVSAEQSDAVYLKGSECLHLPGVKKCLQIECSCLVFTWKEGVSAEQSRTVYLVITAYLEGRSVYTTE